MSLDPVLLTGATGFIGSHVLEGLLAAGHPVRALVRPGTRASLPAEVRVVAGDVTAPGALMTALDGCRHLVHVAALYSFAPRDRARLRQVNVAGTRGLLEAARLAGVECAVVTSSSSTVGPMREGRPATEADWAPTERHSAYHQSKIEQERVALAARLPVTLVLPTAPIGPGDHRPTPTGAMLVDFLRGRMPAYLDGGLNVVAVEDVAAAHVAALQRGRARERYLVGGENLALRELWERMAEVTGRRAPRLRLPYPIALAAGCGDELRCRLRPSARPMAPLEGVRMGRHRYFVDDAKARDELGHRPTPVSAALERATTWFRAAGMAA